MKILKFINDYRSLSDTRIGKKNHINENSARVVFSIPPIKDIYIRDKKIVLHHITIYNIWLSTKIIFLIFLSKIDK